LSIEDLPGRAAFAPRLHPAQSRHNVRATVESLDEPRGGAMTAKHSMKFSAAFALAALLGSAVVASADDDKWSHFLVAPGKYILYSCQQLDVQAKTNQKRMAELEALMAKSGSEFANAIAYRPEYLQLRGELADLHHEAADKKCKSAPVGAAPRRVNGAIIR
jgi:hypothetical protein